MAADVSERAMRGVNTAERIVNTAERLIRHYGYKKTTIADVASEEGMSPANVYRFFASKDDLRRAICIRRFDAAYAAAVTISRRQEPAGLRIRRYLELNYRMTLNIVRRDPNILELLVHSLERDGGLIEQHFLRIGSLLQLTIAEGAADGEFSQQAGDSSHSLIFATAYLWHPKLVANFHGCRERRDVQQLVEFVLRALRPELAL